MVRLAASPLQSERLTLEPLRVEHAGELAPVLDDPALHRFIGGRPATAPELRARFARLAHGRSPDGQQGWLNWTVRERDSGRAIGTLQATLTDEDGRVLADLAWVIGSSHQGRGFAREGAGRVAAWLRAHGVAELGAHIHPDHRASMAVARAVGLTPTDVMVDGECVWASARPEAAAG